MQNAVGLLRLQAAIWTLLSAGLIADGAANLVLTPTRKVTIAFIVAVAIALVMGTFAAAKFRLAARLPAVSRRWRPGPVPRPSRHGPEPAGISAMAATR